MTLCGQTCTSLADQVHKQLKRDVAEFKLVLGDRFTENELCERLDVSRMPVRQALFRPPILAWRP